MKLKKTTKKGFTIVELVIVIAVIAILAAVLIPTFSSLIEKANESVDQQTVTQMNIILQSEEIIDGKPATVAEVQNILKENNADDFTPMDSSNVYYWVGSENRIILWSSTENKVTHPKDLAEKYNSYTAPSADWADLAFDYEVTVIAPAEGQTFKDALLNAVNNAEDEAIIQLPKNETVDLGRELYKVGYYMKNESGTGKNIAIDLNGGKLTGGYYALNIPVGATLELVNGSLEMDEFEVSESAIVGQSASRIIMRNMTVTSTGSAIFPEGTASEIVLDGCTIIAEGPYGVATNRSTSNLIKIVIKDSYIESQFSTGLFINTLADVNVENSTIVGVVHGIVCRAGHIKVSNSTIKATDTEPGIYSYKNFNSGRPNWITGNAIAAGVITIGDYSNGNSYSGDAVCTLVNTKLVTSDSDIIPEVVLAARLDDKVASITYDDASVVGRVVVYGEDFTYADGQAQISHNGTITVNGEPQLFWAIPTGVGEFTANSEYDASSLNIDWNTVPSYDYNQTVKSQIESNWSITLTDTEWQTVTMQFSSVTVNELKSITYTKDDGTQGTASGDQRINLTGIDNLSLLNTQNVSVLKQTGYTQNALTDFKAYCEKVGITVTDSSKIVIGNTANVIVGVK